jgi:hypothetical protein
MGLCECGCKEETGVYKQSHPERGEVKGTPKRFVTGHGTVRPLDETIKEALAKPGVVVDRWILRLGKSDEEAGKFCPWFLPSSTFKQDLESFLACLNLLKLHDAVKERMSEQKKGVREIKKQQRIEQKEIAKMKAKVEKAEAKAQLKLDRAAEKERIKAEAKKNREEMKNAKVSTENILVALRSGATVGDEETCSRSMGQGDSDTTKSVVRAMEDHPEMKLSEMDAKVFVEALTNPPEPNEALKAAALAYEEAVERKPYVIPEEG